MDNIFKLTLISFLLLFSTSSYSALYGLDGGFAARTVSGFTRLLNQPAGSPNITGHAAVSYSARHASGIAYASRSVPISSSVIGGIARRLALTPQGIAFAAAIAGAGYLLNPDGTVDSSDGENSGALASCYTRYGSHQGSMTASDCQTTLGGTIDPSLTYTFPAGTPTYYYIQNGVDVNGDPVNKGTWRPSITDYPTPEISPVATVSPATDEEVADTFLPSMTNSALRDFFRDPLTGLPNSSVSNEIQPQNTATPETDPFQHAADELTTNYNTDITNNTNTVNPTTYNNDYTNNEYNHPEKVEVEDPCKDNPNRVGCSEFGTALAAQEIPTQEIDFSFNPIALSSSSGCPSAPVMNLSFQSITLPNDKICSFASSINPIVLSVATISGILILSGAVRND